MGIKKLNIVENKLRILHEDAKKDYRRIGKGIVKSIFRPMQPADFEHAYLPISKHQGASIRKIIIEHDCKNIVEFGTSFGISTIYLADAARHTGGKVITTEILKSKGQKAIQNIKDAGLSEYVDVRIGDAMQTLKSDTEPIDFLLLDGWKDLYLPLFQLLAPRFHKGTLIYADNMDISDTEVYANYLSNNTKSYSSEVIHERKALLTRLV